MSEHAEKSNPLSQEPRNEIDSFRYPLKEAEIIVGYDEEGKPLTAGALRTIEAMPNHFLRVDFPKRKEPDVGLVIDRRTKELEKLDAERQQAYLIDIQSKRMALYSKLKRKYEIGIPKFSSWIGRQDLGDGESRLGLFTLVEKIEGLNLTDRNIPEKAIPAIARCYADLGKYYFDKVIKKDWSPYLEDLKSVPEHFIYSNKDNKVYMVDIGIEGMALKGLEDWGDASHAYHMSGMIGFLIDSLRWLERNRYKKEIFTDQINELTELQNQIRRIIEEWGKVE